MSETCAQSMRVEVSARTLLNTSYSVHTCNVCTPHNEHEYRLMQRNAGSRRLLFNLTQLQCIGPGGWVPTTPYTDLETFARGTIRYVGFHNLLLASDMAPF